MEVLGYQWQGQQDKVHNADRMLKQAADRFMRMLEDANGPEHLVVFITSDQDFFEKVQELQRRNFKVVVLYCKAVVSAQPVSIINAADEAYEWLPFLQQRLDINLTQPAGHEVKQNKHEPAAAQHASKTVGHEVKQDKWELAAAQHASKTLGHEVKQDKREPAAAQDVSKTIDIELRSGRKVKKVQAKGFASAMSHVAKGTATISKSSRSGHTAPHKKRKKLKKQKKPEKQNQQNKRTGAIKKQNKHTGAIKKKAKTTKSTQQNQHCSTQSHNV